MSNRHHLPAHGPGVPLPSGNHGLAQPVRGGLAVVQHSGDWLLCRGLERGSRRRNARRVQNRPRKPVHQPGVHAGTPGRPPPPASASDGRSPSWWAVPLSPLGASQPGAHRSGTGCGFLPLRTRSPLASDVPALPGEHRPATGVEVSSKQTTGPRGSWGSA